MLVMDDVSDVGLPHLKRLTGLTTLSLYLTKVSDVGVRELQQALPSARVAPAGWPGNAQRRAMELNQRMSRARSGS
jgi:hypothetical protein